MSKPAMCLMLAVDSDLTFVSVANALNIATKEAFPSGEYKPGWYMRLAVSSQGMRTAVPFGYAMGVAVELDCGYGEDEWSLTVGYYDGEFPHETTVWSPGA